MTDTAGLIKDLVWEEKRIFQRRSTTSDGEYQINFESDLGVFIAVFLPGRGGMIPIGTKTDWGKAQAACQSDYEARILSALNLDVFKARIRAEALEEVEPLLARVDRLIKNHHRLQCVLDSMQYPEPDIDEDTLHSTPFQRDTMSAIFALMHLREYLKPYKDDAAKDIKP